MSIAPGTKLGRYEIRTQLGAGGMGEVYRARDDKLNRDVAIKVLPAAFSEDGDRLHRFEQEAQAVAALNHPSILAVYDVGTYDNAPYVVSELLEGETLREAIDHHALSPRKATEYATQIARGLSAAHEKGIIHRDLKPDNVFITADDRVKILDFGLAKLVQPSGEETAQTDIATRKVQTDPGAVMGTAGYMSPEQVRGRPVDHRSDIFSFGAVLYEMLSRRRAFRGESAIETLNAILKEDPPELTSTNPNIAPALERVVLHCLEKSPDRRFQSASDVAFALESLSGVTSHPSQQTILVGKAPSFSRSWNRERIVWLGVCAALLIATTVLAIAYFSRPQTSTRVTRLALPNPEKGSLPTRVTVSPDGSRVVFIASTGDGKRVLFLRSLDTVNSQQLAGTEGAQSPFWSPDSRFIGYFAGDKLFKIDALGGRPQALCNTTENRGGAWNRDGVILFSSLEGLYRVSAQGGTPVLATKTDEKEEAHRWPYFLPDGQHFLFLGDSAATEEHHIRIGSLDSQDSQILFGGISRIAYAPPGYLLYVNQGALVAQPFDARTLKLTGDPTTIVEHVAEVGSNHEFDFSVSEDGVLAYQSGNPNSQLTWFDRQGKKLNAVGDPANYGSVVLSPKEQHAAVPVLDSDGRIADIWVLDLERGRLSRLTFDPSGDGAPVWSPDEKTIVFSSSRGTKPPQVNIYSKASNGAGDDRLLLETDSEKFPTSWSRDGKYLLFGNWAPKLTGSIWVMSPAGNEQPRAVLQSTVFDHFHGQLSPNAKFLAYGSNESGRPEIYIQPFPPSGQKWQISSNGGGYPLWRADGKELFFVTADGHVMSAEIRLGSAAEVGVLKPLFQANFKITDQGWPYAVSADGQRFLLNHYLEDNNPAPMTIVLNWLAGLKK